MQVIINSLAANKNLFYVEYESPVKLKKSWTGGTVTKTQKFWLTPFNYEKAKSRYNYAPTFERPSKNIKVGPGLVQNPETETFYISGIIVKRSAAKYFIEGKEIQKEEFSGHEYAKAPWSGGIPMVTLLLARCKKISAMGKKFRQF